MKLSLDPGTNRSDSSDVITITNRQRDATFVHGCKKSRRKIVDIFVLKSRHDRGRGSRNSGPQALSLLMEDLDITYGTRGNSEEKEKDK